jgi:hypothetical protein
MQAEHALGFLVGRPLTLLTPKLDAWALAAAKPELTRSRMRSRSNSARPLMMVRISLLFAVLRSNVSPV